MKNINDTYGHPVIIHLGNIYIYDIGVVERKIRHPNKDVEFPSRISGNKAYWFDEDILIKTNFKDEYQTVSSDLSKKVIFLKEDHLRSILDIPLDEICSICFDFIFMVDYLDDIHVLHCNHKFHKDCFRRFVSFKKYDILCPLCREEV